MRISTIFIVILRNLIIWANKLLRNKFKVMPYKLLVNMTNKCNSRCSYCDIWKIKDFSDEINLGDMVKLFDEMGNSLIWLALSGGEVTLVKYFDEMLSEASRRCKKLRIISFTTNGLLPDKVISYAKSIKRLGLDLMVTISLDGDEALHDTLRGVNGNHKKCVWLYHELKKLSVNVNYGITVSEDNAQYVVESYKSMRHQIKAVTFVHDDGIYKKTNQSNRKKILDAMRHIYKSYSIDSLADIVEYIHIAIAVDYLESECSTNIIPCEVITTSLHIMQDGSIHPCMYLNKFGNIKTDRLRDVLFSKEISEMKKKIKNDHCPHCWMNCYSPYSIMQHPFASVSKLIKK